MIIFLFLCNVFLVVNDLFNTPRAISTVAIISCSDSLTTLDDLHQGRNFEYEATSFTNAYISAGE